jgi:Xaa-Pro aminopeptidase
MPKVNLPRVPVEERDRRWIEIRKVMQEDDLDALFIWGSNRSWGVGLANLRYVTHMGCREGVAIFPQMTGTEPIIEAMNSMGLSGANIGIVDHVGALSHHSLPYWPFKKIKDAMPGARFLDATEILEKIRMIKSPVEIEFLKKAGKVGLKMLERMMASSREGVNERVVYGDMMRELVVNGGEDYAMNLFTTGSAVDAEQQHLLHGHEAPNSPVDRVLKNGDLVMTEFHANYGGYLVGIEQTISVGEPPPTVLDIHKVCVEVFQEGVDSMRPGKTLRQVVDAFRAPVKRAGMDYIECGIHGHGMSYSSRSGDPT